LKRVKVYSCLGTPLSYAWLEKTGIRKVGAFSMPEDKIRVGGWGLVVFFCSSHLRSRQNYYLSGRQAELFFRFSGGYDRGQFFGKKRDTRSKVV